MKNCIVLLFGLIILSCGKADVKKPTRESGSDSGYVTQPANSDKSYLKKRPEEFQEFFMLTDVLPFTGRVATKSDVKKREAVFNMDSKKDPSHKALNIRLPFFAFLLQPNQQPSKFVVIMQAETLKGDTILGYKEANGLFGICKPTELEYFESQKDKIYTTPK
jgi:hypothetical protein